MTYKDKAPCVRQPLRQLRRAFALALTLGLTLTTLAACGTSGGGATEGSAESQPVHVGLILEDRPAVDPWSAAWEEAMKTIVKADPKVSYKEAYNANTPTDALPVIQQMLNGGFNTMLLTSYTLTDVGRSIHSQYKSVPMAVSSFDNSRQPNLSVLTASYLQMGYVNCWLLTKLSKSGIIGYVNGQPVPFATEMLKGCRVGALAANPKAKVLVAYTNSFSDQQAAVIQAKSLVSQGADALWPASGEGDALGVYQYCESTKTPCAGWGGSLQPWAPTTGVINAELNWVPLISKLIHQARTKKVSAFVYDATYANGGIKASILPSAASMVPQGVKTAFDQMLKRLEDGKIKLPKSTAHPGMP